jgi:gamma-glutamylcyclotransferase (GGCT)/AIG2-like uncharacterized protein YtfP
VSKIPLTNGAVWVSASRSCPADLGQEISTENPNFEIASNNILQFCLKLYYNKVGFTFGTSFALPYMKNGLARTENVAKKKGHINFKEITDMNLFVYGTLMIPSVMDAVAARKFRFVDAVLRGYARFTVKGESYPGIVPVPDAVTEGIVYLDVDELSFKRLDAFEGDLYQRTSISVETEKGEMFNAETYTIKREYRDCLSTKKWNVKEFSRKNLETFLKTYSGFQKDL